MLKAILLWKHLKNGKNLFITFDDGPDRQVTPKILEQLEKNNIQGTFFINFKNINEKIPIIKKIMSGNHQIGIHSYEHLHPWKKDPFRTFYDLYRCDKMLKELFNCDTPYFRPPYGKFNIGTIIYTILFNKKVVFWNSDPKDYTIDNNKKLKQFNINIDQYVKAGKILLLHDKKKEQKYTLQMIDMIIKKIKENKIATKKINW